MKKQIALVAVIALALTACTTPSHQANYTEPRQPAMSESMHGSSATVAEVSMNSLQWSASGARLFSIGISDLTTSGVQLSATGVGISKDMATIVFNASGNVLNFSKDSASTASTFVVTTTGKVFNASVSASKSTMKVSVSIAKETWGTSKSVTLQVWDASKSTVIGSVEVSGEIVDATSSAVKAGKNFVVDTSGTLLNASGQVIGQVWDSSSRAVGFVVDSTSKFFVGASNATVVIFTSASQNSINFAGHVWNGIKSGSTVPVQIVRASAKGSVMIVNASGQSLMAVSGTIGGFHQEKY